MIRRLVLTAVPALLALVACARPPSDEGRTRQGVLVIAVDALRYDHTSFAGYDRATTPRLALRAEEEALVFDCVWSTGPRVVPAHVSLLTGCHPTVAQRPKVELTDGTILPPLDKWRIPPAAPSLATEFLAEGWKTAAFVDHTFLKETRGFARGFREYYNVPREVGGKSGLPAVSGRLFEWINRLDEDEDWFAYAHWNDLEALWDEASWNGPNLNPPFKRRPELEFVPPVGYREPVFHALPPSRVLDGRPTLAEYELRYDTALTWLDQSLIRIFQMLEAAGQGENTTVVFVGSFGIGFGESGFLVDSGSLSDVDLHVPLVIRPAPSLGVEVGRRFDALVSLVDVAPTLLDLVDLRVPPGMHGRTLQPLIDGETTQVRDVAFASYGHADGFCVIDPRWTYESTYPGSRGPGTLSNSWFGDERVHRRDEVRVLKDRSADTKPGHLRRGVLDPALALELHRKGEEFYGDLERVREVLHPTDWNVDKRGPDVVQELRRKGLIGEL